VRAAGAARPRNEYLRWPRTENLKLANQLITFGNVKMDQLMTHQVSPDNLQETYEMIRDRSEPFLQIAIKW
jgi:threonine dehydrogenase-like Zn-dependent dehydrogenase